MTLLGMIGVTLFWLATLIPAYAVCFATGMMSDAGGRDKVEDVLIITTFMIACAFYIIVPISLLIAWIAFLLGNILTAQHALFVPVIHIGVYLAGMCSIFIRQPSWLGINNPPET